MRKLYLFMLISLDGYFKGLEGDISWHTIDAEFNEFAMQQLENTDTLLFGKMTYDLMADYWPTQGAIEDDPIIATMMNEKEKYVISTSLQKPAWQHTSLINANVFEKVQEIKQQDGKDIGIFGSSQLAVSLLEKHLLDELRILINPVLLGNGIPLLHGLQEKILLHLDSSRTFHSGNTLHVYTPKFLA